MAVITRKVKAIIRFRRTTEAEWNEKNPVLRLGEPGFAKDVHKHKIGDGVTPWKDLKYVEDSLIVEKSVFDGDTRFDFPSVGKTDVIYKAKLERKTYQWNPTLLKYESLNSIDDITCINGGNANG